MIVDVWWMEKAFINTVTRFFSPKQYTVHSLQEQSPLSILRLRARPNGTAMISITLQLHGKEATPFVPAAQIPNHHPMHNLYKHNHRQSKYSKSNAPSPASRSVPAGTSEAARAWRCTGWRCTLWGSAGCCVFARRPRSLSDFRLLPDWRRRWPSYLLSLLQEKRAKEGGREEMFVLKSVELVYSNDKLACCLTYDIHNIFNMHASVNQSFNVNTQAQCLGR